MLVIVHLFFTTLGVGLLDFKLNSSRRAGLSPRPVYSSLIPECPTPEFPGVPSRSAQPQSLPGVPNLGVCLNCGLGAKECPIPECPAPEPPSNAQPQGPRVSLECPTLECFGVPSPRFSAQLGSAQSWSAQPQSLPPNARVSLSAQPTKRGWGCSK